MSGAATGTFQLSGVSFGRYGAEEIRKLSVVAITNPISFDDLNHPVPQGLYDRKMGSADPLEPCITCSLMPRHCPGHMGHIELPLVVYNPMLFRQFNQLLASFCWMCGVSNASRIAQQLFVSQMNLLDQGRIVQALDLGDLVDRLVASNSVSEEKMSKTDLETHVLKELEKAYNHARNRAHEKADQRPKNINAVTIRSDLIAQFWRDSKASAPTCWNCKAPITKKKLNPQKTAIFLEGTDAKMELKLQKALETIVTENREWLASALFPLDEILSSSETLQALQAENQSKANSGAAASKAKRTESEDEDEDDENEDVVDGDDEEEDDADAAKTPRGGKSDKPVLEALSAKDKAMVGKLIGALKQKTLITPLRARTFLQHCARTNQNVMACLFFGLAKIEKSRRASVTPEAIVDAFFQTVVAVPPTKYRPIARMSTMIFQHPQSVQLTDVLKDCIRLTSLKDKEKTDQDSQPTSKQILSRVRMLNEAWVDLQGHVNSVYDNPPSKAADVVPGIRQVLEKKEGLFRMHMMGKRVNYAARSVISPDPMISTNEIGIPIVFALTLTYPEPVTTSNVAMLREAVINGPKKHPGAVAIQNEDGSRMLLPEAIEARQALADQLLTPQTAATGGSSLSVKKVERHLQNGDLLLVNRQPTLHKSSIMAHQARVLKGERTIRMHYANCKTYNADFDGDEMNLHLLQNELARSEAKHIALTDHQYFALDGNPLRGLIQDHICAAVLVTQRSALFDREHYQQLVYNSLPREFQRRKIHFHPPCIIKPRQMWSGKQVVSSILYNLALEHIHENNTGLVLTCKAKVKNAWSRGDSGLPGEDEVIVRQGLLLNGVLDKSQIGSSAFGLVHACHELFGAELAGQLLTAMGLLCNAFMKYDALTMGVEDILLKPASLAKLKSSIATASGVGSAEVADFLAHDTGHADQDFQEKLRSVYNNPQQHAALDARMMSINNKNQTKIIEAIMPEGLLKQFPYNSLQLMIQSGAKGSNVNGSQISCLLGQQALEGRRVPVMASFKTLPSFLPFDMSPRANGMVFDSFLYGVRPQDYFFHCMAGREGLIDTAVKTSRSGYLQRCLVKHLEDLRVNYDMTVRDADGSVVQFLYGEDALDVTKVKQLENFRFLGENYSNLLGKLGAKNLPALFPDHLNAEKYHRKAMKNPSKYEPALSRYRPDTYFGCVSESLTKNLDEFLKKSTDLFESKPWKLGHSLDADKLRRAVFFRSLRAIADPGEPVGVIAAQALGEPSTQMTLNTFHFAGHGDANVTLGVPRLREILMTASKEIKTPVTTVPLLPGPKILKKCEKLVRKMQNVLFKDVMRGVEVMDDIRRVGGHVVRHYDVKVFLMPTTDLNELFGLSQTELLDILERRFIPTLCRLVSKSFSGMSSKQAVDFVVRQVTRQEAKSARKQKDDDEDGDDQPEAKDDAADSDVESIASDDIRDDEQAGSLAKAKSLNQTYGKDDDEEEAKAGSEVDSDDEPEPSAAHKTSLAQLSRSSKSASKVASKVKRLESIQSHENKFMTGFDYDEDTGRWVSLTFEMPLTSRKIFFVSSIEELAAKFYLRQFAGITRCRLIKSDESQPYPDRLQIEGDALKFVQSRSDILDVDKVTSNNIYELLCVYGVESARAVIIDQLRKVFDVYAIKVDHRHLSLIADYMTFEGGYKPMNRMGMASNVSPFTAMSFETTGKFLEAAVASNDHDTVASHSSRLVVGRPTRTGTGSCDLLVPIRA
eukprot:m.860721 g.860721  ORF g.860721 m.860721 type:complete len:1728 (-) comp59680_c0_seq2:58-5241(-)